MCANLLLLRYPHPKLHSASPSLFTTSYQHPWAETFLETWMATMVTVVVSMSVPVGRKVAAEARKIMTFYGSTCAAA